jgi:hypothetical protein
MCVSVSVLLVMRARSKGVVIGIVVSTDGDDSAVSKGGGRENVVVWRGW